MTAVSDASPGYRRATVLMTSTSMLVPLGGLVTAPVLAQGLGAAGRGELAAALAPATLMLGVATLGLPEALTFFIAKRPSITRRALGWATLATVGLGAVSVALVWTLLPFLSAGDPDLARLILVATIWNVPALVVAVLRGAATGRQWWGLVAWERIALTVARVGVLFALLLAERLTVETAVLASVIMPVLSGLVYVALLRRPPAGDDHEVDDPRIAAPMFRYGTVVWLGSIASMVIGRLAGLLMLPMAGAEALGLYTVATTIADVPLVVALAVQGTLFGVSSRASDASRVTATSRISLLVGLTGVTVMGASLPWWLGPLFGEEFMAAAWPTVILLTSAVVLVPGLMASSGLAAWGRPALRSAALVASLVVHLATFLLFVPAWGAWGAAWSGIAGTTALTAISVLAGARVLGVSSRAFLVPGRADMILAKDEVAALLERLTGRR
ncbi:oligosaccharide flippase family protein [Demequina sp. NBRC 110055]|uniref:oligosaccharide flippase family protein n=1 Tax=Demequina sp. NBRC 110055 TaxID=1570344 RepID=UPI000A065B4F|nr:oligosaccharide flippase family protein [Demequina sp. NBRC 110055]